MVQAFQFQPGWKYNADRIAAADSRMAAAGCKVNLSDARPDLKGFWKRLQARGVRGVFAQDSELKVIGHWRDTNEQARGTCVGQGSSRGVEDTHTARLAKKEIPGKYTLIAFEPMYGGERHAHWGRTHEWGCRCGNCPDGLQGADAAEWYVTKGPIARRIYGNIDLTKPREDLAITWNNTGVPEVVAAAGLMHKVIAHKSKTLDDYADAIASECYGDFCLPQIFTGNRQDQNGCCEPDGNGGHCTECCGVFLLPSGETAFVIQQSWPLGAVHYRPTVITADGPKQLRPGSYPVRQSVLEGIMSRYRDGVEMHSYDIPSGSSFR